MITVTFAHHLCISLHRQASPGRPSIIEVTPRRRGGLRAGGMAHHRSARSGRGAAHRDCAERSRRAPRSGPYPGGR